MISDDLERCNLGKMKPVISVKVFKTESEVVELGNG
jgi:hypothetical protein